MFLRTDQAKGLFITLTAVFILSPDALLVRLIRADSWSLLFWRGLLAGSTLLLLLILLYRTRLASMIRDTGRAGLLSVLVTAAGSIFFVMSLHRTAVANTLVILASIPLLAAIASRLALGERVPARTWIAVGVVFFGVLVLFSGSLSSGGSIVGDLFAVGAACCWGGNIVIVRSVRPLNMIPANALGNLAIAPVALLFGAHPLLLPPGDLPLLLLLGVVVLPVSYGLIILGPRYLSAPEVSLTLLLETLLGPFWVWLVIAEEPSLPTVVSGILILGTLVVHTLSGRRQLRPVPL